MMRDQSTKKEYATLTSFAMMYNFKKMIHTKQQLYFPLFKILQLIGVASETKLSAITLYKARLCVSFATAIVTNGNSILFVAFQIRPFFINATTSFATQASSAIHGICSFLAKICLQAFHMELIISAILAITQFGVRISTIWKITLSISIVT